MKITRSINHQIDHPFNHHTAAENTHASKLDFRFVPALLASAIPSHDMLTSMLGLYIINNIAGFIFFMCILRLVFQYSGNRLLAALAALNFAVSICWQKLFSRYPALERRDCFYVFGARFTEQEFTSCSSACLLLAFFTDERALFGGILAFVYCRLRDGYPGKARKNLLYSAIPFLSAYVLYLVIRASLKYMAGMDVPVGAQQRRFFISPLSKGFSGLAYPLPARLLAYKSAWVIIALSVVVAEKKEI